MADDGSSPSRLGQAAAAFTSNWRNPSLRRAQLSFLGAWTAEWAFTVALGIVAYRDGGAAAVGLVGLLRMVPSAILAPLLSPIADRGRRERVLILVSIVRGAATAAAAVVVAVSGPSGGHLRARGAVDDRRHPLPPGALRAAAVAVPHRLRARERQHGARAARLRGHARRSAGRGGPAAVHRGRRRVLGRRGRVVRGGRPARAVAIRRPSATSRAEPSQPGTRGGRGCARGRAESRPDAHPRSRGGAGPHPGRAHRVLGGGRDRAARHRRARRRRPDDRGRGGRGARVARGVAARRVGATGRLVRRRGRPVGAAAHPRRPRPPAVGGAGPAGVHRRRQRPGRSRRVHADRQDGSRRGARARLRRAREPGGGVHRNRRRRRRRR